MGNKKKRKLSKWVITAIITAATAAVLLSAILITNIFIPIKYLTAYCVKSESNEKGVLRVSYIDVDFGDCTLIELPDGKTVLIDGGDGAYPNTLAMLKFLNGKGIEKLDYLICTSVKKEHCGGLAELLKYKKVGFAYIPYCKNQRITAQYNSFINMLGEKKISYAYACEGEGIADETFGYFLTFLSPLNIANPNCQYGAMNAAPTTANIENASAVCWLEYVGTSFAFTSDVRAEVLKNIVEDYAASVEVGLPYCQFAGHSVKLENCTFVTVPCHAGANGAYAPWYDLIKPEQAVVSVGKSFADYPSIKALSDVCNYCTPLYTMHSGSITVAVTHGGYKITTTK